MIADILDRRMVPNLRGFEISIESIIEGLSDGVFTVNMELQITAFNRAAEQMTGMSRTKAIGRSCSTIFRSSLCGKNCLMRKTLDTHSPVLNSCALIINSDGQHIPVSVSTTVLRNEDNKVIGGIETFRDIRRSSSPGRKSNTQIHIDGLITRNQTMAKIINLLPQVAASQSNVLIEGEEGTGKEMMARAIHALSIHKQKPFIVVNCRALSDRPYATALFDNQSDDLTDTPYHDKAERSAFPAGSTLFLKELNETNRVNQSRLLLFLQENKRQQKDSINLLNAEIRVIASTTSNLFDLVINSSFRRDLYSRVNAVKLALPPLRKRKEDIPLLTNNFISHFNQMQNKSVTGVNQETLAILMDYNFPGNIRELKNIIKHAFASCAQGYITPAHLPQAFSITNTAPVDPYGMEMVVQAAEAQAIIAALRRNNFHRKDAARELGIHKSTFFRKIKNLGIVLPQTDGRFRTNNDKGRPS